MLHQLPFCTFRFGAFVFFRIPHDMGEECYVDFTHVMWYPEEDESAEAERAKRQLV